MPSEVRRDQAFTEDEVTMTGRATAKQRMTIDHLTTVDGIDARFVRPSDWPALRDWIDEQIGARALR